MAWTKIPSEHHPVFRAALPNDPRVETLQMFGGIAAKVNGHMFAGLFGRSAIVQLSDADRTAALALDGAALFDPMGNGRVRSDKVMLPEDVFHEPAELRQWIARAFEVAATLPRKTKAGAKPAATKQPAATKPVSAKQATKPVSAKQATKPVGAKQATKPVGAKQATKPVGAKQATKPVSAKQAKKPVGAKQAKKQASAKQPASAKQATKPPPAAKRAR